jgi:hypothetical protein
VAEKGNSEPVACYSPEAVEYSKRPFGICFKNGSDPHISNLLVFVDVNATLSPTRFDAHVILHILQDSSELRVVSPLPLC